MADPRFKTGAIPTPRHRLLAIPPFRPRVGAPEQFAYVPARLDMWGNDQYGDCVSAEEAFAKACHDPEIFIPADEVIRWARSHNYLNGAMLDEVMDDMIREGFRQGSQLYNDGPYRGVDFSNEAVLQAAIAVGPVKIGMASRHLPNAAGNEQGWYAVGKKSGGSEDHCTALCGYGPAGWLYQQLGVNLPSALKADMRGYLLYTWSTIGFVDHEWIMGATGEAFVRNPTTIGVPPLPDPVPPTPTPTPTPGPNPFWDIIKWILAHYGPDLFAVVIAVLKWLLGAAERYQAALRVQSPRRPEGFWSGSEDRPTSDHHSA